MHVHSFALGVLLFAGIGFAAPARTQAEPISEAERAFVDTWLDGQMAGLLSAYQHLHAHPELSLAETETAAFVARELRAAGYRVLTGVGGTGVVGVLENGPGPTLLIRADMDALPVREATGLAYASRVETRDAGGDSVGVMHACGHDVHVTSLVGSARLLAADRDHWSGSLVFIGQPAEEIGRGALLMIEDGLFDRVPRPDYSLALHVESDLPAGQLGWTTGWAAANVDAVDITVFGRGGHGARPHMAVDPIVTAAQLVTTLQTLVSRRIDPREPAVVTVGSIHGGSKHNVIPDEVHLQLTVRSYSDGVRKQLLDGIRQISEDTCRTFGCPRPPEIVVRDDHTPAVYNDPALAEQAAAVFRDVVGTDRVVELAGSMGGEDFGRYARALGIPGLLFRLGAVEPERFAASLEPGAEPLPSLHSSRFAPDPEPTLRTGIRATSHLALALLARR